jgi:hypothetical protein
MGTMLRRVAGTATWHVYKDGAKVGDVTQNPDGSWGASAEGDVLSPPTQSGTRKDAAATLVGSF